MGLLDVSYKLLFRRNSVYVGVIIAGAFIGERMVNQVGDSLWESHNAGKLWKHMEAEKAES